MEKFCAQRQLMLMLNRIMYYLCLSAFAPDVWSDVLKEGSASTTKNTLFPTLYVGESAYGLYAIAAFVDKHTITYGPKYLGPPLLEGPSPIALSVGCNFILFNSFICRMQIRINLFLQSDI
uniref:Uncharacterized protein n=1 Tax=Heterorhabditis bacteriophora TaxID=37862 RepID=A0A1I7WY24_HETBA